MLINTDFKKSLQKKIPSFVNERADRFLTHSFTDNIRDPELTVTWLCGNSMSSCMLPNVHFINRIPRNNVDANTVNRCTELGQDINIVKNGSLSSVKFDRYNGERLKEIIDHYFKLYLDEELLYDACESYIYKTTLKDAFGEKEQFRVYMLDDYNHDSGKQYLRILFLDPYHLAIPSKHHGKNAEQVMLETYDRHKNDTDDISKLIMNDL